MSHLFDTQRFSGENLWFTSDTHFNHANIIKFCNRPFGSVEEMDAELIRRWNEVVPPDGVIFHLGDFAFGGSPVWNDHLSQLHGKKYLILGNHDLKNIEPRFTHWFEAVTQQMTIQVGGQTLILNHNPFLAYGGAYRDTWQLFGHVHSGPRSRSGVDVPRLNYLLPRQYDVGVDANDFRPVSFREVKAIIENQIEKAECMERIRNPKHIAAISDDEIVAEIRAFRQGK